MSKNRPYELREYDPDWKERFEEVAKRIRPILGDNVISIEHIGSTSIEGMIAKPQIDVLVVVEDLDRVKENYDSLQRAGFTVRGRGYVADWDEYVTEDAPSGRRLTSVHILQEGTSKIEEYRNLRDYLCENEDDRNLYIKMKRDLYAAYSDDYATYDREKDRLMEEIKQRAREWAARR